ncbi:hypothetical protein HBI60_256410 [Parastagonospora nodorum]|nr:hypothetical protein HBI60_256410 [Parastagonospora nodorum]
MLFGCGVVVVVFVGPGRCSTVPRHPHLPGRWKLCGIQGPRRSGAVQHCPSRSSSAIITPGRWVPKRTVRGGHDHHLKSESEYLLSIMLRRSCV